MLVLTRNARETDNTIIVTVGDVQIRFVVIAIDRTQVRIGVDAPEEVQIDREEVHLAKMNGAK